MLRVDDSDFRLYVGDVREVLATLPAGSVDCCVTSPPYWGLRDYGTGTWAGGDPDCDHRKDTEHQKQGATSARAGRSNAEEQRNENFRDVCGKCGATRVDQQIGLEATPDAYVEQMVAVFREVRRVLADTGTLWLNLGDSYAGSGGVPGEGWDGHGGDVGSRASWAKGAGKGIGEKRHHPPGGLKPKDLVGIPWRVAFALQADGWYLRSDIIWSKPNPMPESVTDRPTKAHEYVFLLSKQPRYFFDQEAVREPAEWARWGDQTNKKHEGSGSAAGWIGSKSKAELQRPQARRAVELFEQAGLTEEHARAIRAVGITDTGKATVTQNGTGKNDPAVIALADEAKAALGGYYREFLVPNGRNIRSVWEIATQPYPDAHFATFPEALPARCIKAGCPEGGTVLDPFMGSGTTALVARKLGRKSVGIELNPEYADLCAQRLQQLSLFG